MKCPAETIKRFNTFIDNIELQKWQECFVLQWGYKMFIEDLGKAAKRLHEVCEKILNEKIEDEQ